MGAEGEVGAKDVVAEESNLFHILNRALETADRDRVFGADIEVTFSGSERIACDHHALDDFEGVAFEDRTVHECAGVALVAVADDVFLVGLDVGRELPFAGGRESSAATAADTRGQDFVDDLLRGHRGEDFLEAFEGVVAEGFLKKVRIDERAAVEGDADLLLVEVDVVLAHDLLVGLRVDVEEFLADFVSDEVLLDDLPDVGDFHRAI